ncbi:hypothetical protein DJ87_3425 [Bacillus cereus]|nr:hypothetical protein DJ87_3425 [Bacillus cereus]
MQETNKERRIQLREYLDFEKLTEIMNQEFKYRNMLSKDKNLVS